MTHPHAPDKWRLVCAFPAHQNGAAIKTLSFVEEVSRSGNCRVLVSSGHEAEAGIRLWSWGGECLGEFAADAGMMSKHVLSYPTTWSSEALCGASAEEVLKEAEETLLVAQEAFVERQRAEAREIQVHVCIDRCVCVCERERVCVWMGVWVSICVIRTILTEISKNQP